MTLAEFRDLLIELFYCDLRQTKVDNYDWVRLSHDGVDRSQVFDHSTLVAFAKVLFSKMDAFHAVHCLLADAYSKDLFINLIRYKLAGHLHVRIGNSSWAEEARALDAVGQMVRESASELQVTGLFGPIKRFEGLRFAGREVRVDCWLVNLLYTFFKLQYVYRGGKPIGPRPGDVIIDGGAGFGDTAIAFALLAAETGKVYAFDPLPVHQQVIRHNVRQNGLDQMIEVIPFGLDEISNSVSVASYAQAAAAGPNPNIAQPGFRISEHESSPPTITIDEFVEARGIERIDFVKMDIEAHELAALKGANKTISRFRPTLAISVYHRPDDLVSIPNYLASHFPNYQFYLDHYTIHHEETILFALPAGSTESAFMLK